MKKFQKGFTLYELLFVFGFVTSLAISLGLFYVGVHFLLKFW